MQTLTTIAELDQKISQCHAAAAESDAALRRMFDTFRMAPPNVTANPFSDEYARAQMELYSRIAGRPYGLENESYSFDVDDIASRPFPYSTRSPAIIGDQLIAIGSLIKRLKIPSGGSILEFGPGWGNTTLQLAQSGFQVTAVDIEPSYCELIRRRAEQLGLTVDIVNSDFMLAETVTQPFDAVIFFECFHHCADHLRLLRALRKAVKPEGRIYFAGEPITDKFPMPWGLRLDGESLWAIRHHGWLELGFTEEYFRKALHYTGWEAVSYPSAEAAAAHVWEAKRITGSTGERWKKAERRLPEGECRDSEIEDLRQSLHLARMQIEAFQQSTSWKVTAPFRAVSSMLKR